MSGGGGSSAPTETRVTNTNLPEYVAPYFKRLLQRGEADTLQDYTPYGGQRLAYFSPDEQQAQAMTRGYANQGTPQQYQQASNRYSQQTPYAPAYAPDNAPASYQAGTLDSTYQAPTVNAGYQARDINSKYNPELRKSQYQAGQTAQSYQPLQYEQNLQRFMSPYQQNVTDIEKREAARQSEIMGKNIGDQATAQGSLGGYREAIQQSERERNLSQQMGDIQTRGSQAAFESAQQQLERERAGGMGAAQFELSQFKAQESARQQQEQLAQRSFETGEQARQQKETFDQAAYASGEQARQQAAKLGLNAQQQQDAANQAQERFNQSAFQQQQQALQQQSSSDLARFQAQESAKQQQEKFGQSAYDLSNRYNLASAAGLQDVGQATQQNALSRIQALQGIGSQQRALQQASLDTGYQDFLRQQNYANTQLGRYSNLLQGVPSTPEQNISTFQQQPGAFQTAVGAGLTGLGLYRGTG